ncbi:hypothetical protein JOM56_001019 [Amanita muscaria]
MTSLYTTAWKAFVRSLIKLLLKLWSFILYLRSFSSRSGAQHFFTPKPRSNRPLDADLEGGRAALLHPRSKGLSFTSTSPSPCVRRPRATTLAAYHPPCAESTPRMTVIVSRSSALSLSTVENGVVTDNRLSEDSGFSALPTCSEEPSDAGICYRTLELDSDKPLTPNERVEGTNLVRQRDSADVDINKIKGTGTRRQMSLPSKCLSPLKTLSLANSRLEKSPEPTQATSASLVALNDPASNYQIGYLEYSYSVDRGLSMMQQLLGMTQYNDEKVQSLAYENLARRLKGNLCAKSEGNSDAISMSSDTLEPKQEPKRCQSGFGLHDVSYVKGMLSLMRADVEQDGLTARNIFNRESVLTYRKSAIHSKGAKFRSRYLSANVENDKNVSSVNRPRTHRKCISQASLAISRDENVPPVACGDDSIRLDCFRKPGLERRRFRYRSATHGLDVSPSMQLQLKVEKIKRQRRVRQEMVAHTKLLYSRQSNRDTYEWFAEDIQVQDCES